MNETYRAKLAIYAEPVDSCGPLYKSENSDYMKSLKEESGGIMKALDFKHYLIDDSEWTFDIASQYQPRIELFIDDKLVESSDFESHFNLNRGK
ncbi:MAG TPA: hypothetical protein VGW78_01760 [Candidatus Babeliales bacterium]|jgi:hypothetical protein|nr:hypothetical protein [Candidatus Babeliales bacterium]